MWKMGKVKELEISTDGLARTAILEYKNATETVFRTTRRSVRKIAILHREGNLELVQELNEASRRVGVHFMKQQLFKPEQHSCSSMNTETSDCETFNCETSSCKFDATMKK